MKQLLEPLGHWRSRFLFHLFGFCLLLWVALKYKEQGLAQLVARGEWEFHVLAALSVLLLVFGARLLLIAVTAAWALVCFGILLSSQYRVFYFPAAEWTLWLVLSTASMVVCVIALVRRASLSSVDPGASERRYHDEVEWGITRVFRVMACVTLGFAALHKANADFFDPEFTCVSLREYLHDWWNVSPKLTSWLTPAWVVILEAVFPLLLIVVPSIGLLLTSLLVLEFGSIGAVAFAGMVITMSGAFLPHDAGTILRRGFRRQWPLWLTLVGCAWGYGLLFYSGTYPLWILAAFQTYAITAAFAAGLCAHADWRVSRDRPRPQVRERPWAALRSWWAGRNRPSDEAHERPSAAMRGLLASVVALAVFNGMTPYLGLKFQYSFAMLSNLRVDDARWNSYVFPRSMRLTDHDPYVHILRVTYRNLRTQELQASGGTLDPGLYSPTILRFRLRHALEQGYQVTFDFVYNGQEFSLRDTDDPSALYDLIEQLPHTPLWQGHLAMNSQGCVH
ncbi:MAG: hypothetical protein OXU20_00095 [Myxococcales bacterium]|nr:hypothetical protein [Myxococcales bacterium]